MIASHEMPAEGMIPFAPREWSGMPRADKTLDAMRANPRDWRIEKLEAVAAAYGVNVRKSGGSHVVFEHPGVAEAVSGPARRPIKPIYVRRFVAFIEAVRVSNE
jgi:hypothetical protein